ncbi:hypothetical protein VTJ04DRAFT_3397 [Mycothermus thermophilus]|uniref:uncharacterized protein n=1 Tax=Humicola insolens TaxID=85995 RepID=UPI00374208B9
MLSKHSGKAIPRRDARPKLDSAALCNAQNFGPEQTHALSCESTTANIHICDLSQGQTPNRLHPSAQKRRQQAKVHHASRRGM